MKCGENTNPLYPGQFGLVIESDKFKAVEYFCTQVNLPSINISSVNSSVMNYENFTAGDSLKYSSLSLTFILDEELKNYLEIFNWMRRLQSENYDENYDAVLLIYNNRSRLIKSVRFMNLVPTMLGEIAFSSQETPENPITVSAEFGYSGFHFE